MKFQRIGIRNQGGINSLNVYLRPFQIGTGCQLIKELWSLDAVPAC